MIWGRRPDASRRVVDQVLLERGRHADLGYTAHHDDQHSLDHLVTIAGLHAMRPGAPLERREQLVKAAAVLVAGIELIDRKVGAS